MVLQNNAFREYYEMNKEIKNSEASVNTIYKYDWISRKTHKRNCIETIVNNDEILWLNEKHIEEGLDHKNVQQITTKHHSDPRKHWCERVEEPKKQSIFKQYDVILIIE